ncbi:DinB family protein [Chitinophagaceae bacterium MMS25-I14]
MAITASGTEKLYAIYEHIQNELLLLLSVSTEKDINTVPFPGSWTLAQVAVHLTKSGLSVAHNLSLSGKLTGRDPELRTDELKGIFLDFERKFTSPEFIRPTQDVYAKESVIADLRAVMTEVEEISRGSDPAEVIDHPAFGDITKLELLHFVIYHSQRHLKQMQHISDIVRNKQ